MMERKFIGSTQWSFVIWKTFKILKSKLPNKIWPIEFAQRSRIKKIFTKLEILFKTNKIEILSLYNLDNAIN